MKWMHKTFRQWTVTTTLLLVCTGIVLAATTAELLKNGYFVSNTALVAGKGTGAFGDGTRYVEVVVGSNGKILVGDSGQTAGVGYSTVTLDAATHKITNVTDPASAQDAATKNYVDTVATGIDARTVRLATAAALPANTYSNGVSGVGATLTATGNAALSVDGSAVALSDRLLIKNEAAPANNGIYFVTQAGSGILPYILTRALDMDTPGEFAGVFVAVPNGTANANTMWVCTAVPPITVGTTAIPFTQFSPTVASGGNAVYGDGSDATLAFDGVATPVGGATLSGSTYTMTRDIYAATINISTGVTIATANFRIFCTGNCGMVSGSGTIDNSGLAGSATGAQTLNAATQTIASRGGPGAASSTTNGSNGANLSNAIGGSSGAGGSGASGSGGTLGTATAPTAALGGLGVVRGLPGCLSFISYVGQGSLTILNSGCGGGGGGGDGTAGAGGGAGGGAIIFACKTFSGTLTISANGGAGGNASGGTNTGGGGGGGGGAIIIVTSTALPGGVTLSVAGGALGAKKAGGTGNNGNAGSSGNTFTIIN